MSKTRWSSTPVRWPVRWKNCTGTRSRKSPSCDTHGFLPAYNVQAAVDAEHALIVAQQVTVQAGDNGSLQPMAEAAQAATGGPAQAINVVADAGYSNGEQAEACEAKGILPHVPANRGVNSRGDGTLFDRTEFRSIARALALCTAK